MLLLNDEIKPLLIELGLENAHFSKEKGQLFMVTKCGKKIAILNGVVLGTMNKRTRSLLVKEYIPKFLNEHKDNLKEYKKITESLLKITSEKEKAFEELEKILPKNFKFSGYSKYISYNPSISNGYTIDHYLKDCCISIRSITLENLEDAMKEAKEFLEVLKPYHKISFKEKELTKQLKEVSTKLNICKPY